MVITSIDRTHDGQTANGLYFAIEMTTVRQASPQTATVEENIPEPVATKTSEPKNAGQTQVTTTPKQGNNKESDERIQNIMNTFKPTDIAGRMGLS